MGIDSDMLDRLLSALVALSLAFLVWLYVRSRDQETLDNVPISVQVVLTPGQEERYEIEVTGPSLIPVSFIGPPSRMRELRNLLQRGELHILAEFTVPDDRLEESRFLDTVHIEASDIHTPAGVTPLVVEGRNRIPVTLHRLIERRLPVRFENATGARIAQMAIEPASVLVRGPQDVLDRTSAIPTLPYGDPSAPEPLTSQETITAEAVPLTRELAGRKVRTTPETVTVRFTLQPQQKLYELTDVPVQFLCPSNFPLRPLFRDERAGKMTLRLLGPAGEESPTVTAYVDLGGKKWEAGLYEEPLKLQLPKDYQLAQPPPRQIAFQLLPLEPVARTTGTASGSQ
jgi:hypothetical protein